MTVKTSQSSPLRIDALPANPAGGVFGVSFRPGKKRAVSLTGPWDRNPALADKTIAHA